MAECPHFTKVGTCQVRGEPVVHGEQKRCQTSVGRRLCLDWQRARAAEAEADAERLAQVASARQMVCLAGERMKHGSQWTCDACQKFQDERLPVGQCSIVAALAAHEALKAEEAT